MAIGGNARAEFPKKVGLFEGKVLAINPNREQYESLTGFTVDEESKQFDYLGEDKDTGVPTIRLNFLVEDVVSKQLFPINFFLKKKVRENKDKTKLQFINSVGLCTWAVCAEDVQPSFTKFERTFREAYEGEEELFKFLRSWLSNINFFDAKADLTIDMNKDFNGNVRELTDQIKGSNATTVLCMATIRTVAKDGEDDKEFQNVYNRDFLPGNRIKNFRLTKYTEEYILGLIEKKKANKTHNDGVKASGEGKAKYLKDYEEYALTASDSEHGIKDFYSFDMLKVYDASENPVASDNAFVSENTEKLPF